MPKKPTQQEAPMVVLDDPELATSGKADPPGGGVPEGKAADAGNERAAAFYGDEFQWKGQPLHGLSSGRWGAFLEMRAGVTSLPFLDSLGGDGWFADSLRILYFCATEPQDWRPFRRDAMAWQEEIEAWAGKHVEREDRIAAEALAFEIYKASRINRHEIAPAAKGAGGGGK
jgi:hypothetical protein